MSKFKSVSSAFRFFDSHCQCLVSFPEFSFGLEHLNLSLTRDDCLQVFTFLDNNQDGKLCYYDFCTLAKFADASESHLS